jgi:hypothetical protein
MQANAAGIKCLTCPSKNRGAQDKKKLYTHPIDR